MKEELEQIEQALKNAEELGEALRPDLPSLTTMRIINERRAEYDKMRAALQKIKAVQVPSEEEEPLVEKQIDAVWKWLAEDRVIEELSDGRISSTWFKDRLRPRLLAAQGSPSRSVEGGNGWISVKDRLPENDDTVLIYDLSECINSGYFEHKRWVIYGVGEVSPERPVTHWQELPSPPIEPSTEQP